MARYEDSGMDLGVDINSFKLIGGSIHTCVCCVCFALRGASGWLLDRHIYILLEVALCRTIIAYRRRSAEWKIPRRHTPAMDTQP